MTSLRAELTVLLGMYPAEQASGTPDFILAEFLLDCLDAFDRATNARSRWYRREDES